MKKKVLSALLAASMTAAMLAGCGNGTQEQNETPADTTGTDAQQTTETETPADNTADTTETPADDVDYGTGEIKVWVADNVTSFTEEQIAKFMDANPQYSGYTVTVEAVGEGDAAGNVLTDVKAAGDIFGFAQDQLSRLVAAGAIEEMAPENVDAVKAANDAGSVAAATVGGTMYAYPLTSDNGYFLYYDKSVVTDPTNMDAILADCEAAGKNFYMEINSGWYQTAFFFGAGAEFTYETDDTGAFTACNSTYASDNGVKALKAMVNIAQSKAFVNGSSMSSATNVGAIVDGTWDAQAVKDALGDNYACAKLPEVTVDGDTFQLGGFGGYKLLGVKPQEDENKLAVCDAIANYLASEEVQQARYEAVLWGPSNVNVQKSEAVQADEALAALAEQLQFAIPQGQYPGDYWTDATALGDSILSGEITPSTSDDDLMKILTDFETKEKSYAGQ